MFLRFWSGWTEGLTRYTAQFPLPAEPGRLTGNHHYVHVLVALGIIGVSEDASTRVFQARELRLRLRTPIPEDPSR